MKWFCGIVLVVPLAGCAPSGGGERHVPPAPAARQALDAALAAWVNGQAPGAMSDQSPPVQVVDSMRRPGQKLVGYEILGEVASDKHRSFLVQLRLENPPEAPKVRFCVLGVNPLWVFREDELDMIGQWACGVPEDNNSEEGASKDSAGNASPPNTEETKK
jgi:hypothetical protein